MEETPWDFAAALPRPLLTLGGEASDRVAAALAPIAALIKIDPPHVP